MSNGYNPSYNLAKTIVAPSKARGETSINLRTQDLAGKDDFRIKGLEQRDILEQLIEEYPLEEKDRKWYEDLPFVGTVNDYNDMMEQKDLLNDLLNDPRMQKYKDTAFQSAMDYFGKDIESTRDDISESAQNALISGFIMDSIKLSSGIKAGKSLTGGEGFLDYFSDWKDGGWKEKLNPIRKDAFKDMVKNIQTKGLIIPKGNQDSIVQDFMGTQNNKTLDRLNDFLKIYSIFSTPDFTKRFDINASDYTSSRYGGNR